MKKVLLLLLALSMLLAVFAGCGKKDDEEGGNQGTVAPIEPEIPYELPTTDMGGREVTIVIPDGSHYQFTLENNQKSDIEKEGVSNRNDYVESDLSCVIAIQKITNNATSYADLMNNEMASQSGDFDVVFYPYWFKMETHGYFCNLLGEEMSPYIAADQPFYCQGWNDMATIRGMLEGIVGYGSWDMMQNATAMFYNMDMYNNRFETNPYDLVDNGQWTLELVKQMSAAANVDLDGDGMNAEQGDTYGMLIGLHGMRALFYTMGGAFSTVEKGEDPVMHLTTEHNIAVFDKIYDLYNNFERRFAYDSNQMTYAFRDQEGLFVMHCFGTAAYLNKVSFDYGILPFPKFDENQTEYISGNNGCRYFSIPTTVDSRSEAAIFLNAFNYYSLVFVKPAYFDGVLKLRYSNGSEDARMVDLIMDNIYIDFNYIYDQALGGNGNAYFDNLIMSQKQTFKSFYDSQLGPMQTLFNTLVTNYTSQWG